jgi:DNA (cytosine-5)-methyltransferase 1
MRKKTNEECVLNGLDLFSGIGGLTLALAPWVRPIAYCENDRYSQSVLLSRMADGRLPHAPIWDDVRSLSAYELNGLPIEIIYGGFPCQNVSSAGAREGLEAKHSGLFFEIVRLAEEIRPAFIFLENVPGIRGYLSLVAKELAGAGYDCRWDIVSAQEVGASHIRKRWFCLAYAGGERGRLQSWRRSGTNGQDSLQLIDDGIKEPLANSKGERRTKRRTQTEKSPRQFSIAISSRTNLETNWTVEPAVGRVVNGLPNRVERIKCLGNAVVPAQAREAFMRLINLSTPDLWITI